MKTIAQQIKWDFEANGDLQIRDKNSNLIYFEDSDGFWVKQEYDSQGKVIYIKDSKGYLVDNRPKHCENKEIVIEGIKYKLTKV